jgi:hypothetical protein
MADHVERVRIIALDAGRLSASAWATVQGLMMIMVVVVVVNLVVVVVVVDSVGKGKWTPYFWQTNNDMIKVATGFMRWSHIPCIIYRENYNCRVGVDHVLIVGTVYSCTQCKVTVHEAALCLLPCAGRRPPLLLLLLLPLPPPSRRLQQLRAFPPLSAAVTASL